MPPPTITTCAVVTTSVSVAMSVRPCVVVGRSVVPLDVGDQALEQGSAEGGDGPLVLLHPPWPEGEVELAGRLLDRGPQGPSILRHQAPQAGPCDLVGQVRAVVGGDQVLELVVVQVAFAPDVAQLEAGVVVAGVLIVDERDAVAVVDEVAGQQVVVAGDRGLAPHGQGSPD